MPVQVAARFGNFAAARLITRYGVRAWRRWPTTAPSSTTSADCRPDFASKAYWYRVGERQALRTDVRAIRDHLHSARCAARTATPYFGIDVVRRS